MLVIGAILTLITLLLWFTRLQMRIYLSERHLALDARERRAFAQAYVAMLKGEVSKYAQEDLSPEEKERVFKDAQQQRGLVYAALFRATKEGMVKEDAALDPTLTAAISKLLMK